MSIRHLRLGALNEAHQLPQIQFLQTSKSSLIPSYLPISSQTWRNVKSSFLISSHLWSQSINSFFTPSTTANITYHSVLFFFGCATQLGGFLFPDQRLNPCPPAVEVWSLNHWTARELPPLQSWIIIIFSILVLFDLNLVCILLPSYYSLKNCSHWISIL